MAAAATAAESFLEGLCKPFLLYVVFMAALILYNVTQMDVKSAGKNTVFLAIGGALIFFLCFTGFEMVAWILLAIPPFFFVALIALLIVTQLVRTKVNYADGTQASIDSIPGFSADRLKKVFGMEEADDSKFIRAGGDVDKLVGQPYGESCDVAPEPPLPTPPPALPPAQRIAKQINATKEVLQPIICPSCNTCDTCQ